MAWNPRKLTPSESARMRAEIDAIRARPAQVPPEVLAQRRARLLEDRRQSRREDLYHALAQAVTLADGWPEYGTVAAQLRLMRDQVSGDLSEGP